MSPFGSGQALSRVVAAIFAIIVLTMHQPSESRAAEITPSDVYTQIDYATRILDQLLQRNNLELAHSPVSRETDLKPMHVYELHVTVLKELYDHATRNGFTPPPLPVSTPITYTPGDVIKLSRLIRDYLEEVYGRVEQRDAVYVIGHNDKTPSDVYGRLFALYARVARLNGKVQISPNDVYAQIFRAREDLQYILITLSRRFDHLEERKKRLLVTGVYGMGPDNSALSGTESGRTPADVLAKALTVRDTLNRLREKYDLAPVNRPRLEDFGTINPIDVFLQTQFIIAEINLLKQPLNVLSITNPGKVFVGKTPSDVLQEMKLINYMLDRMMQTL